MGLDIQKGSFFFSFFSIFNSCTNFVREVSYYFHFTERKTEPQKREGIKDVHQILGTLKLVNFPPAPQCPIVAGFSDIANKVSLHCAVCFGLHGGDLQLSLLPSLLAFLYTGTLPDS